MQAHTHTNIQTQSSNRIHCEEPRDRALKNLLECKYTHYIYIYICIMYTICMHNGFPNTGISVVFWMSKHMVCILMYGCTFMYMCSHNVHMHMYMNVCMNVSQETTHSILQRNTHMYVHVYIHIHSSTFAYTCKSRHAHTHTYIHMYVCMYVHT
jgi:hypothetical protein